MSLLTRLLILSGPSGAGKTTLTNALIQRHPSRIQRIITVTTRPPRTGEQQGIDYHFVTEREFESRVERGELLEQAEVYGHRYGTLRRSVEECLRQRDGVLILDVQGFRAVTQEYRNRVVSAFVVPPNLDDLTERLRNRSGENQDANAIRLSAANAELAVAEEYDCVILNADTTQSIAEVNRIFQRRTL